MWLKVKDELNNIAAFQVEICPREKRIKILHSALVKHWTEVVSVRPLSGPPYLEAHGQVARPDLRTLVSKLDLICPCGLCPGGAQCLLRHHLHIGTDRGSLHLK